MINRINILIGSDINYAMYYGVMLTSLFMNNRESQFDIYLLTDDTWTDDETAKFEKICELYNSRFFVLKVNANDFKDYPKTGTIALSTYYRLEACRLLPTEVHKILYLDGDMIVCGDIRPLWNTDLTSKGIACVLDSEYYNSSIYERLGLEGDKRTYCNAGVSLYNLDFWRDNDIRSLALEYIEKNMEKLYWMDQDVMNILLYEHKVLLSSRYNMQTLNFTQRNWNNYDYEYKELVRNETSKAVIIHYSSQPKPWNFRYYGAPYYAIWEKYRKLSLWKNCRVYTPVNKYVKYLLKRYIFTSILRKQINNTFVNIS